MAAAVLLGIAADSLSVLDTTSPVQSHCLSPMPPAVFHGIFLPLHAADDGCFKLDLKGVLYQATVLPLAGTALVANIGPTEAKVSAVC